MGSNSKIAVIATSDHFVLYCNGTQRHLLKIYSIMYRKYTIYILVHSPPALDVISTFKGLY